MCNNRQLETRVQQLPVAASAMSCPSSQVCSADKRLAVLRHAAPLQAPISLCPPPCASLHVITLPAWPPACVPHHTCPGTGKGGKYTLCLLLASPGLPHHICLLFALPHPGPPPRVLPPPLCDPLACLLLAPRPQCSPCPPPLPTLCASSLCILARFSRVLSISTSVLRMMPTSRTTRSICDQGWVVGSRGVVWCGRWGGVKVGPGLRCGVGWGQGWLWVEISCSGVRA